MQIKRTNHPKRKVTFTRKKLSSKLTTNKTVAKEYTVKLRNIYKKNNLKKRSVFGRTKIRVNHFHLANLKKLDKLVDLTKQSKPR